MISSAVRCGAVTTTGPVVPDGLLLRRRKAWQHFENPLLPEGCSVQGNDVRRRLSSSHRRRGKQRSEQHVIPRTDDFDVKERPIQVMYEREGCPSRPWGTSALGIVMERVRPHARR